MRTFAINGQWADQEHPLGRSEALQFGAGLFETIRVQEGRPLHWEAHMARLTASAQTLGFPVLPDPLQLKAWTEHLLSEGAPARCALKLVWHADGQLGQGLFYFRELDYGAAERKRGLRVCLGRIRRNPDSHITGHKTLNYLDNLLERRWAKAQGFHEALLVNTRGEAAEGTASNLFLRLDGGLLTPPAETGLLPGIQRQAVLEACRQAGIPCREAVVGLKQLLEAEGLFLTNSLMGFMPVSEFLGTCYDRDDALVDTLNQLTGICD